MSDLVDELRSQGPFADADFYLLGRAADEIERLRAEAKSWEEQRDMAVEVLDRLRAALEAILHRTQMFGYGIGATVCDMARTALAGTAETGSASPDVLRDLYRIVTRGTGSPETRLRLAAEAISNALNAPTVLPADVATGSAPQSHGGGGVLAGTAVVSKGGGGGDGYTVSALDPTGSATPQAPPATEPRVYQCDIDPYSCRLSFDGGDPCDEWCGQDACLQSPAPADVATGEGGPTDCGCSPGECHGPKLTYCHGAAVPASDRLATATHLIERYVWIMGGKQPCDCKLCAEAREFLAGAAVQPGGGQ